MNAGTQRRKKVLRDNIQGITKPALKRLTLQAGAKSISGPVYDQLRSILKVYLEEIIRDSILYTESARRKRVSVEDVINGIQNATGEKLAFDLNSSSMKKCKN